MRKVIALSLIVVAIAISVDTDAGVTKNHTRAPKKSVETAKQQPANSVSAPPGTILGSQNPELIPDQLAYSTLFRMISNRQTAEEKNSIRAYIRQVIGLGKTSLCLACRQPVRNDDAEVEALLAAADEFHRRVSVLDARAKEIKDRTWPNPSSEVMAQLTALQHQKEAIVAEIIASLPHRLSADSVERVRQHINRHVKSNIRLTPTPATLPGGDGWQHQHHQ